MKEIDCQYISSGYKHQVFRCEDYAYKIVKEEFKEYDCREHFESEYLALNILRTNGFCVPNECEILSPNESFLKKWTLKESWMLGKQYLDGQMPKEYEKQVFNKLIEMANNISGSYYGLFLPNTDVSCTWHAFLRTLHENYPLARIACPKLSITSNQINELIESIVPINPRPVFIAMDTNLMNFFFDNNGTIVGIIDIEHQIFGDFPFLLANIRWRRDHSFHRDDWYSHWVENCYYVDETLIDLYEFLIAFQEIHQRFRFGTSRNTIDNEFLILEKKMLQLI